MKYVAAVGVELEGGWNKSPGNLQKDLSVKVTAHHVGEMASRPFKILENLETWIKANAPDVVDTTCGFHIHISLKQQKFYNWLTSPRFYKLVLSRIRVWGVENSVPQNHHFWKRWKGTFKNPSNNRNFCRKEFIPEKQLYNTKKGEDGSPRHCHLNYCLAMHGTIELRLFPAFPKSEVDRYFSAVKLFVDTAEEFLRKEELRQKQRMKFRIDLGSPIRRVA